VGSTIYLSDSRRPGEWTPLVIDRVIRDGEKNIVHTEFLDSNSHEKLKFECFSVDRIFDVGGLVHKRGEKYCYFDREDMKPVEFEAGGLIQHLLDAATSQPKMASVKPIPLRAPRTRTPSSAPRTLRKPSVPVQPAKAGARKYDLTEPEAKHFHSKLISVAKLCERLQPVVKRYAREGTRKPRDVSVRLNFDGFRTAVGEKWTPRLTYFLLGLIFGGDQRQSEDKGGKMTTQKTQSALAPTKKAPLTREEIMRRLEALGRVVAQKKP